MSDWHNTIPSSTKKKKYNKTWTTEKVKQTIQLDLTASITAEHQKCTVDLFFSPHENWKFKKNSNVLILLYCYKTTLSEVLQ